MMKTKVTVIVPTTAQQSRREEIRRCIRSIRESSKLPIQIIVVVNGSIYDADVCAWLKSQQDVVFQYVDAPSAPNAVLHGRSLVGTEFFSTLDDDDEYVPGATDQKLERLMASPESDLVVTNTRRICDGKSEIWYSRLSEVPSDPIEALFFQTWLNSGNALFRTSSVSSSYFENPMVFAEWTWLAFKLAIANKHVAVLNEASNIINVTSNSLSQSEEYLKSYVELFKAMRSVSPPKNVRKLIDRKMSAYWHDNSERALERGEWFAALGCHMRSLFLQGGLRYLSYSRHFFALRKNNPSFYRNSK